MKGLSLFANVGIAETYLHEIGIDIVVANELLNDRARFYKHLYPKTNMIQGDITNKSIYQEVIKACKKENIDLIMATPPCQGMSLAGIKNPYDERNTLIKYAVDAVVDLKPKYVLFENVVQQLKTPIEYKGKMITIPLYIIERLGKDYNINENKILNTMDYGIPQNRKRALFLLTRKDTKIKWEFPKKESHIVTLEEAIGDFPSLYPTVKEKEYGNKIPSNFKKNLSFHKWHQPKTHAWRQIEAMLHTPTGQSAYKNLDYFPKTIDGKKVSGGTFTYMRMDWKKPAPTVTMYNGSISSFTNVHPGRKLKDGTYSDPRVLTIFELMKVTSLPDDWNIPEWASENLVRRVIGEGIPPLAVKKIFLELLKEVNNGKLLVSSK